MSMVGIGSKALKINRTGIDIQMLFPQNDRLEANGLILNTISLPTCPTGRPEKNICTSDHARSSTIFSS